MAFAAAWFDQCVEAVVALRFRLNVQINCTNRDEMPDPIEATVVDLQPRFNVAFDLSKTHSAQRFLPSDPNLFERRRRRTLVADHRDANHVQCFTKQLDSLERQSGVGRVANGLFPQRMNP